MKTSKNRVTEIIVARLERGEDLYLALDRLVNDRGIRAGCIQVIGAVGRGRVGVFINKKYDWVDCEGPMEIASCIGNVTEKEGKPFVHCHAVFAGRDGLFAAGHVGEGCIVDPTAEVHIQVFADPISRKMDSATGLWFFDI